MLEFWNLMDTPAEEQQKFIDVSCNIAATVSEITKPNSLSTDLLEEVHSFTAAFKSTILRKLIDRLLLG